MTDDFSVLVVDDNEINLMLMEDILDVSDFMMKRIILFIHIGFGIGMNLIRIGEKLQWNRIRFVRNIMKLEQEKMI